ncbi:MAG: hypothetical protein EGQ16_02335 [Clostridiales bacterium]|nr:hypothetical protein [Clostridiales bacterium]
MNELEIMNNNQIIKKIYKGEEDKIDNIIKDANKEIKDELKVINIENIIDNANNPREIRNILNDIEDNYNIKITKYNEEMYKLGFMDGINLIIECLKK